MEKILLDTNFLLIAYQFKVDIFQQIDRISTFNYEIIVLDKSLSELNYIIEKQRGKNKDAAKFALKLLKMKKVRVVKNEGFKDTDDAILDYAKQEGCIVATQDKDLKRRLINYGLRVLILRQKKILTIINDKGFN